MQNRLFESVNHSFAIAITATLTFAYTAAASTAPEQSATTMATKSASRAAVQPVLGTTATATRKSETRKSGTGRPAVGKNSSISSVSGGSVPAVSDTKKSTLAQQTSIPTVGIEGIEHKLFEVSYANDSMTHRIERIEKLVFGEVQPGSEQDRLTQVLKIVPPATREVPKPVATTPNTINQVFSTPIPTSNYPSVTALEGQILGSTHRFDQVQARLDRLETKAFGAPSKSNDLALRVQMLQRYTSDSGLAPKVVSQNSPPPAETASADDKLAWLEQQTYGRVVADSSQYDRVRRLNMSVFPVDKIYLGTTIPANINMLLSAVELDQAERIAIADGAGVPRTYKRLPNLHYVSTSHLKLNSTATALQRAGAPSPLQGVGLDPNLLDTTEPGEDTPDSGQKKKKKKKSGGLMQLLKEAIDETAADKDARFGIPSFSYGRDEVY